MRTAALQDALPYLLNRWTPDSEAFVVVEFRVPRWDGLAKGAFPWELPADPLIATLVLDYSSTFDYSLATEVWDKISNSLKNSLTDEIHGHWVDFLMKKEGEIRALPANTRYHTEMLLAYLSYLSKALFQVGVSIATEKFSSLLLSAHACAHVREQTSP